MRQLDTINRKKIIDIVRTKVAAVLEELVPARSDKLRVTALLGRTYERLTWQNGLGEWCLDACEQAWNSPLLTSFSLPLFFSYSFPLLFVPVRTTTYLKCNV